MSCLLSLKKCVFVYSLRSMVKVLSPIDDFFCFVFCSVRYLVALPIRDFLKPNSCGTSRPGLQIPVRPWLWQQLLQRLVFVTTSSPTPSPTLPLNWKYCVLLCTKAAFLGLPAGWEGFSYNVSSSLRCSPLKLSMERIIYNTSHLGWTLALTSFLLALSGF